MALKPAPKPEPKLIRKAFSMERGKGGWVNVTVSYDEADKVVSVTRSEPNLKALAIERFKIDSFRYWSTLG